MNRIISILSILLMFASCHTESKEKQEVETMNVNDIQIGDVIHDSLTSEQLEKIKKYMLPSLKLTRQV